MGLNWRKLTPKGRWLVVKADPRVKVTRGGIVLPDQTLGIERVMEGTGHLLKVGDREEIRKVLGGVDLEPGMRIAYRGFMKDAFHEFEMDEDGQLIFILRTEDVMAVIDEDVKMGFFS